MNIIQNAIKILEFPNKPSYLVSSHVHDFKSYTFKDGREIFVDGGKNYIRRGHSAGVNMGVDFLDFSLHEDDLFDTIKNKLLWSKVFSAKGKILKKRHHTLLVDCPTSHLQAILRHNYPNPSTFFGTIYHKVIEEILSDRKALDSSSKNP